MARKILILRRLNHPNVVKLEGLVTSRMSCSLYLVFEYMEHDLAGLAATPNIKFTEPQTEINYLGQLRHHNIVNLIGYCLEEEHRLLIYEFMPHNSLENHKLKIFHLKYLTWNKNGVPNRILSFRASIVESSDEDCSWCCKGACFPS